MITKQEWEKYTPDEQWNTVESLYQYNKELLKRKQEIEDIVQRLYDEASRIIYD